MNYRHIYHAGNFADVVKHISLIHILDKLRYLHNKMEIIDGFAGAGLYELSSKEAKTTEESLSGVLALLNHNNLEAPKYIIRYVNIIKKYFTAQAIIYPGSPLFIRDFLSSQDKAIYSELHEKDYNLLAKVLGKYSFDLNYKILKSDAYYVCQKFSNTDTNLILLDPPYEKKDEFVNLLTLLKGIIDKACNATIMIWYPVKDYRQIISFYRELALLNCKYLKIEFSTSYASTNLQSNGIIIINPPEIYQDLEESLEYLKHNIYQNKAIYTIGLIGPQSEKI
ncbi:MAG: 23S rRNA (adenine(2030)-N(6))-methyltransferase RlmJ [Rickettsiaceae bacterium]|nr:23S rRNA (adenine(2030)-N(6))-methyltransferase RlmJ [Rickettsiaceae bacterium]